MNTADIVAELESRYRAIKGVFRAQCQTGELYVAIGLEDWSRRGVQDDGSYGAAVPGVIRCTAPRRHYLTEDEACAAFMLAFDQYVGHWRAANPGGDQPTLFWRYDPPVHWHPDERSAWEHRRLVPFGAIKCRLVLSNLPVVDVPDDAYDAARRSQLEVELLGGTHG